MELLHEKYWIDMGTRETYIQAQADALEGKLALKTSPSRNPEGPLVVPPVHIGKDCEISNRRTGGPLCSAGGWMSFAIRCCRGKFHTLGGCYHRLRCHRKKFYYRQRSRCRK